MTRNQNLTPQQQGIGGDNVEREETSHTGTSAEYTGTSAGCAGTSAGHAGIPTSGGGTPIQFGGDGAREQEAEAVEQTANQDHWDQWHEVCRFNVSQLPHVDNIHRVPPFSNDRRKKQLTATRT